MLFLIEIENQSFCMIIHIESWILVFASVCLDE